MSAGRQFTDTIQWNEPSHAMFSAVKNALGSTKTIHIPQPTDHLWIVTDGAVKAHRLCANSYITRGDDKPKLSGFFSAKLRKRQIDWQPCELEALCIAASIRHFAPYIIQSHHRTCILTDSKPCVQAYQKLSRGVFSTSSRLITFLTAASRYQLSIRHLSGSANRPSDFTCRNAPACTDESCQICQYIATIEESAVRSITVQDVTSGSVKLPFVTRSSWKVTQQEDADLRRTHAHLTQGTRPSKKATSIKDVKRYLQVTSIARDGLLVVRREITFGANQERIVVPRLALPALLTAVHIKFSHPTCHQMEQLMRRYFYALDMDHAIDEMTHNCYTCASQKSFPTAAAEQTSSPPPSAIGTTFAADVIRRQRQFIFILREYVTCYTLACIIPDERAHTLRDAILSLCLQLRASEAPPATICVDPAPGFQSLIDDSILQTYNISVEIGHRKNRNKNPVAERAVQEMEIELLKVDPAGNPADNASLTVACNHLNSRIRSRGLSSREMFWQRDQFNNCQITTSDEALITLQHQQQEANHLPSERVKAPNCLRRPPCAARIGDLVHIYSDQSKLQCRDRYYVCDVQPTYLTLRKLTDIHFRCPPTKVKPSDCYLVPGDFSPVN